MPKANTEVDPFNEAPDAPVEVAPAVADTVPAAPVVDEAEVQAYLDARAAEQELKMLTERATQLKIKFHPSIGADTLRTKIAAAMNEAAMAEVVPAAVGPAAVAEDVVGVAETENARNRRLRMEANRLVRVVVNCMNPNKQLIEGEIFTVSNSVIGTVKKYVPFNIEAGWHIPYVIYLQLKERKCQVFFTVLDQKTGMKTRQGKLTNEFNVVILPQLTAEELKDLAALQAAGRNID